MSLPSSGRDHHDDASLPPALGVDLDRGLAADPEALARVRAQVTAEFRRSSAAGSTRRAAGRASVSPPRGWRAALRPLAPFGLAGALVLGSVGLVAANSGPGDPFYGLRLAAEELSLLGPATHLDRLQQRLDEASRESDNASAVSAALKAYREELQRALDEATDDAGRQAVRALETPGGATPENSAPAGPLGTGPAGAEFAPGLEAILPGAGRSGAKERV